MTTDCEPGIGEVTDSLRAPVAIDRLGEAVGCGYVPSRAATALTATARITTPNRYTRSA